MLAMSSLVVAASAPMVIGIVVTLGIQVDTFNDRTTRPIPVAVAIWDRL